MIPTIILALTLPIVAHTPAELNEWLVDWDARYERSLLRTEHDLPPRYSLNDLTAEYDDMRRRHPSWDGELIEIKRPTLANSGHYRGVGSNVEQWRPLVSVYPWNADIALCLMAHESGGNPNAQNPSSGASGLMQVLPSWADNFGYQPSDLFISEVNLQISYALYEDGGWDHWAPWLRGECR